MKLKVKEYLTKENIEDLNSFGFESENGFTYYQTYGEHFELILNPYLKDNYNNRLVVINYLNGNTDKSYIDEYFDITEIYSDIEFLINTGIIIKER